MKNHPANAGGISVPSKLRLPIRLKVGLEFAFHRLTPVVCAFDVIKKQISAKKADVCLCQKIFEQIKILVDF
ncbi:MAG: hypothetical protein IKR60_03050 [Alphaproteobacteria bacterium]|nr:hypothetical protein [Alphaproteobacteria bacterium]